METLTLVEAKEQLEDLVARAIRGEEVCIKDTRGGMVRLAPMTAAAIIESQPRRRVRLGILEDVYQPPEGLLDPLPEDELKRWWGERG